MDAPLSKLQSSPPRSVRRRKRRGDYDAWESVNLSFKMLAGCVFCLLVGWLSYPLGLVLLIFGGLLSIVVLPLTLGSMIEIHRHKQLVKYGCSAVGEVLSNEGHNFPDFGGYQTVLYRFVTGKGVEVQGKWEHAERWFWYCKPGDKFIVLYWPQKPSSHIAYESALFEAERLTSTDTTGYKSGGNE